MKLKIFWTEEALETFTQIVDYIRDNWSQKEVDHFVDTTEKVIGFISENPFLFRRTNLKSVREALISHQTLLIYKVYKERIDLLIFWDTRRNPLKK